MTFHPKAVVFDAYGTLLDINSLDNILADHFGAKSKELSLSWRKKQLEYTWLRTLMQQYRNFSQVTMDALIHSCKMHQLALSGDLREQLSTEYLCLAAYPEVQKTLKALASKVPLGILSNANHEMLQGAIQRNHLVNLFAHIMSAEDIGMFKPRPEVYQMACNEFDLQPHKILFVSSNPWDVAGAKSFGLTVAWLKRFGGVMDKLDQEPDYVFDSMDQLLSVTGIEHGA